MGGGATSRWLERYRSGDRGQVWTEIVAVGPDIRDDRAALDGAWEVARETMGRARRNVERLIEMLGEMDYRFAAEAELIHQPPDDNAATRLDELEVTVGPIPIALRAWFEIVGNVDLTGSHPAWSFEYTDPLVVNAPSEYVLSEHEAWSADRGTQWERRRFTIDVAPDFLHKANVSGGAPYGIEVPCAAADALLIGEFHQTTFVNYLRIAFRFGGFPGWDRPQGEPWRTRPEPTPDAVTQLARQLEPL